jgi:hypothetical protein
VVNEGWIELSPGRVRGGRVPAWREREASTVVLGEGTVGGLAPAGDEDHNCAAEPLILMADCMWLALWSLLLLSTMR